MSGAASLGLSLLWDTDIGLSHVDKYTYAPEEYIKAGALLATGLLNSGVRTEADAAIALLGDYTTNPSVPLKTASIVGLGLAYAGSHREDLLTLLLPGVADESTSTEIAALSALSLGFVFVGSGNGEITSTILQTLMERDEKSLGDKWGRFLALGLALLYVGKYVWYFPQVDVMMTQNIQDFRMRRMQRSRLSKLLSTQSQDKPKFLWRSARSRLQGMCCEYRSFSIYAANT